MVRFQEEYIEEIAAGCKISKSDEEEKLKFSKYILRHLSCTRRISWGDYDHSAQEENSISSATGGRCRYENISYEI